MFALDNVPELKWICSENAEYKGVLSVNDSLEMCSYSGLQCRGLSVVRTWPYYVYLKRASV